MAHEKKIYSPPSDSTQASRHFDGIEVGSVSIKSVRMNGEGKTSATVLRHEGDTIRTLKKLLGELNCDNQSSIMITGQSTKCLLNIPYKSEIECLEKALLHYKCTPDLLLSLGGENFTMYTLKDGRIKNIISPSKCAAGTGEFLVQQFQRMGFSMDEGIDASYSGRAVELSTRCAVFCKSDIIHKLNKGEYTRSDIARTLIEDLVQKVCKLINQAQWPSRSIVVAGGLVLNRAFIGALKQRLSGSKIIIFKESCCLEAFGASLYSSDLLKDFSADHAVNSIKVIGSPFTVLPHLKEAEELVDYRAYCGNYDNGVIEGGSYILGIDAGSTTTKAVLFNAEDGSIGPSCYLQTHGNPVTAAIKCMKDLMTQTAGKSIKIIQAAATGSGRELVSILLDNSPSFNEIMSHARSASEEIATVDTLFEIGGQDSKYTSFLEGIPVDYAMNDGCSAGTGSFLEEILSHGMNIPVREISARAELSLTPLSFGERCSAFINTDIKNAIQEGQNLDDIIAGLSYSIAKNYLSRVVGVRSIGNNIIFQGGVALNKSVALALAALTKRKVVVPSYPELMGCIGSCLLARDQLLNGDEKEKEYDLGKFIQGEIKIDDTFTCNSCENLCEIKRYSLREKKYPFGGLCSKYEMYRHKNKSTNPGKNFFNLRSKLLLEDFGQRPIENPRGTIGIPMALTTYEFFPFYAKLINELGYTAVLSRSSRSGMSRCKGPICYPCEIAHGAVDDLQCQKVDYIFLPYLIEGLKDNEYPYNYVCTVAGAIPGLIENAFENISPRLLSPHIALSDDLISTTRKEIRTMGRSLGLSARHSDSAFESAFHHYRKFKEAYGSIAHHELNNVSKPIIIVAGRPYITCSSEANLSIPNKICSRGYDVVPADMLPFLKGDIHSRNVWLFTQQIINAVDYAKKFPNMYLCFISCFSCMPDASIYHLIREKLAGETFCYLEIDSHTAHLGFDTRIGAFMDIIENKLKNRGRSPNRAEKIEDRDAIKNQIFPLARLSEDQTYVIDSKGERVEFSDPRVMHVYPFATGLRTKKMLENIFNERGWRIRVAGELNRSIYRHASQLCSGRECMVCAAITSATCYDIAENRDSDEITIYYNYDQVGPCQDAAWPIVWETFARRLQLRDAVFMTLPTKFNKYLGEGNIFGRELLYVVSLGDIFDEAEAALQLVARDPASARAIFKNETDIVISNVSNGLRGITSALGRWAESVAKIPLRMMPLEVPKVLIFGGANVPYFYKPVSDFLFEQGIIPKTTDMWEGLTFTESEPIMRFSLKRGVMLPKKQFRVLPLLLSILNPMNDVKEVLEVINSRSLIMGINYIVNRFRTIAGKSGLLYDVHTPYHKIADAGHPYTSYNAWCGGTTISIGKYITAAKTKIYDGFINLSAFNCQPVINSQTIIRNIANSTNLPYLSLDVEGPWLSAHHKRLLEATAVQVKRFHEEKLNRYKN
jgi:predicted CoA-substrate-specific enzyme activase